LSIELVVVNYRTYPELQRFIDSYIKFQPKTESHLTVIDVDSLDEFDSISNIDVDDNLSQKGNIKISKDSLSNLPFVPIQL
jgi:hypothetical protein